MKNINLKFKKRSKFKTQILGALILLTACSQTSREDLLSGNFGAVDQVPPLIISPKSESKITPDANGQMKTTLTWGSKVGALRYTLEIALDSNFSKQISGSPVEIKGQGDTPPENSYVFTAPDSLTYYWRVRANITEEGKYSEAAVFHAMDAVYVHCPASVLTCSEDTDSDGINDTIGNKSKPYRKIQTGVNESTVLQLDARVARRDTANTAYNESFNLISGAKVYGGFESSTWQRDTQVLQRTKIESANLQVVNASLIKNQTTVLDGFNLKQVGTLSPNYVIYSQNNNANLNIQNNTLISAAGGITSANNYAIYNNYSSPNIKNNIIYGIKVSGSLIYNTYSSPNISFNTIKCAPFIEPGNNCYGILNSYSSPIIYMNTITGGRLSTSPVAIASVSSVPMIMGNTLDGGNHSTASSKAIFINSSEPFIALNLIHGGSSVNAYGIDASGVTYTFAGNINIIGNTIDSGNGATSYGIYNSGAGATFNPNINANLIRTRGSGNRFGIFEANINSDPLSVLNNFIFDTGSGGASFLYADYVALTVGGGGGNCVVSAPVNADWNCIFDSDNTTNAIEWSVAPDAPTTNSGNITLTGNPVQTIANVFPFYPSQIVYTSDGNDANVTYDGNSTRLELANSATCSLFVATEYFEYFYNKKAYQIAGVDCVTTMTVTFSPALDFDFGQGVPILLWNTTNTNYDKKYVLKTGSPALNAGSVCPAGYSTKTHVWATGAANQADCDNKVPFAKSTFAVGGQCRTTFLYPATEIMGDSLGNENGLCEAGETCLQNPNIGAYAGHGNLTTTGACSSASLPAPFTNNVTLLKYEMNGY